MRFLQYSPIASQSAAASYTSSAIDMSQIYKMSAQVVASSGTVTGTLQLQVSDDPVVANNLFMDNVFTHWSNLGSAVSVSAAGTTLITQQDMCYRALRAVFTSTVAVSDVVTTIADTGEYSVNTITFDDFAGSTSGDYVVITDASGLTWAAALDKTGSAPAPTGAAWVAVNVARKVNVDISAATTADDVATAVKTALNLLVGFTDAITIGSVTSGAFDLTCEVMGPAAAPVPHNSNDSGAGSIVGASSTPGVLSNLNDTYFTIGNVAGTMFYVWNNVGGEGTDPMVAGMTGVEVTISAGDSADNVATAIDSAFSGVPGFTESVLADDVTLLRDSAGYAVPAEDSEDAPTGFTFVHTAPTSSITVNLFAYGV